MQELSNQIKSMSALQFSAMRSYFFGGNRISVFLVVGYTQFGRNTEIAAENGQRNR